MVKGKSKRYVALEKEDLLGTSSGRRASPHLPLHCREVLGDFFLLLLLLLLLLLFLLPAGQAAGQQL